MKARKGIILAGGHGSRLYPITSGVSKQLMPVFDKPMIYYPLSVLMFAGIREIAIIINPEFKAQFKRLLGDGSQFGICIIYIEQPLPDGLAQAYILAEDFLDGAPSALILGDNIFYGDRFSELLVKATKQASGASVFAYRVSDPQRYGIVGFDEKGVATSILEKPKDPVSIFAITGLYFLDEKASERAKTIEFSKRGELEITTLLDIYLEEGSLLVEKIGRGYAWFDTGTFESLLDAGNFVRTLQKRQGLLVGSPHEIGFHNEWVSENQLLEQAGQLGKNEYGRYLADLTTQYK